MINRKNIFWEMNLADTQIISCWNLLKKIVMWYIRLKVCVENQRENKHLFWIWSSEYKSSDVYIHTVGWKLRLVRTS